MAFLRLSIITLVLAFMAFSLTHCGPEKSSEEQRKEQQDQLDKLSRNELLDLAAARLPLIEAWAGCYTATYVNDGVKVNSYLELRRWRNLITPGDQVEPVEMPELRAFMRAPSDTDGRYAVALTNFDANRDASYIVLTRAATAPSSTEVRLELVYESSGKHTGYYKGGGMPSPRDISLVPTKASNCEL
jgi:hypothetical protein